MRSIALANQKGGVGKTTSAVHLAHALALAGRRVALVDLDPQGNATLALQGMLGRRPSEDLGPFTAAGERFWVLPSVGADRNLQTTEELDVDRLAAHLESMQDALDVLIVDCPPRMDSWGLAGLRLCEQVLVPVQAEFFAMHGLTQMMDTLAHAQAEFEGHGALLGIFVTMFDHREQIACEVLSDLRANLGDLVLDAVVIRDPQFIEAASHGRTLFEHNLFARGVRSYVDLAREVAQRWAVSRETIPGR